MRGGAPHPRYGRTRPVRSVGARSGAVGGPGLGRCPMPDAARAAASAAEGPLNITCPPIKSSRRSWRSDMGRFPANLFSQAPPYRGDRHVQIARDARSGQPKGGAKQDICALLPMTGDGFHAQVAGIPCRLHGDDRILERIRNRPRDMGNDLQRASEASEASGPIVEIPSRAPEPSAASQSALPSAP